MIAAPGSDALIRQLPVRVVARAPAGTSRLRVTLGGRNVSARFRAGSGARRIAHLTRADGLRYGANRLVVTAQRRGRQPLIAARTFFLLRRQSGLVHTRLEPGAVTSLTVRLSAAARRNAIGRPRFARLWLNGKRITRALDGSHLTRWTASLSATHGLRHGANRLRILVAEPEQGRYALVRRQFVVPGGRHLASAGWDVATPVSGRVRLNGRQSRAVAGAPLTHRWRILARPRGSHARLRDVDAVRPSLTPDRPGRYVIGHATASRDSLAFTGQLAAAGMDTMTVTAGPSSLLLPFKGLTKQNGTPGILVGDTFYPNTSPNASAMQWLTLDRATLTPKGTGNSWFDGTANGLQTLKKAVNDAGLGDLVVLSFPWRRGHGPPVQRDQMDGFNDVMERLGVGRIDNGILGDDNKLAIVGVPYGGPGSGWYTHGGYDVDAMKGWLMPDTASEPGSNAYRFRFQSDRPEFETAVDATATTNRIHVNGQTFEGKLPAGATGGFHAVRFDPIDLSGTAEGVFPVNGVSDQDALAGLEAMRKFLTASSIEHVVIQTIGSVSPPSIAHSPYEGDKGLLAWKRVRNALAAYGANPNTFAEINGRYAAFAGAKLAKSDVAQSSSAVVVDPTKQPPVTEPGTLEGRTVLRNDGYHKPMLVEGAGGLENSFYDIAFTAPAPWPYTAAAGEPQAENYARALAYITTSLGFDAKWGGDLRRVYTGNTSLRWPGAGAALANLPYPGDKTPCSGKPSGEQDEGFTREQFCKLHDTLLAEFAALGHIQDLFSAYKDALTASKDKGQFDLDALGEQIRKDVEPDDGAEIAWTVIKFLGKMVAMAEPEFAEPWEIFASTVELASELTSEVGTGAPIGDQVTTKVSELAHDAATQLFATKGALDRLFDVIVSDPKRLAALGKLAQNMQFDETNLRTGPRHRGQRVVQRRAAPHRLPSVAARAAVELRGRDAGRLLHRRLRPLLPGRARDLLHDVAWL